jgi:hypothetical protein
MYPHNVTAVPKFKIGLVVAEEVSYIRDLPNQKNGLRPIPRCRRP